MADNERKGAMPKNDTPPATGGTGTGHEDGLGDAGRRALQAERDRAKKAEADAKAARDELAKAQADQTASQSQMDKILAKLEAAEKRSAEAERRALLGEVVAETGLSMKKVARLQGETVEDLLADAQETFDWKPKGEGEGEKEGAEGDGGEGGRSGSGSGRVATPPPKERLIPDPGSRTAPEVDDPMKLADMIPRMFE